MGRGKSSFIHFWWKYKLVSTLEITIENSRKKTKVNQSYDPIIPLMGIYLNDSKSSRHRDTCLSMFTIAVLTIVKLSNQLMYAITEE